MKAAIAVILVCVFLIAFATALLVDNGPSFEYRVAHACDQHQGTANVKKLSGGFGENTQVGVICADKTIKVVTE